MPIPKPSPGELKGDFMTRCMSFVTDETPEMPHAQAVAICTSTWFDSKEASSPPLKETIEPAMWLYVVEIDQLVCDKCRFYEGKKFETREIWDEFPYAMPLFENVIEVNLHPNCRCILRLIEEEKLKGVTEKMHKDFIKIQDEFTKYYCKSSTPCEQGTSEFNAWVKDLGVNTSKPYGKSLEAFQWAKDMISKLKEDEDSVCYKVLFAFPIESMNGNIYTETEIKNSVKTIIGKSPSLNHWEDTRKEFQEGGVEYIGAEYEDGGCEAILKVPKDFICPMCGEGKTLTSLIDEKKIVNVSLEATCELIGPGNSCLGLEFDAPSLLTSDTLPGIPMARIFPLEKVFSEALAHKRGGKKLKIEVKGLRKEEMPDGQFQCPEGQIWSNELGQCVEDKTCPDGQHWDDKVGSCVPNEKADPEGTNVDLGSQAAPDTSKKPIEAMSEDELKDKIASIAAEIDKHYDDGIDTSVIEPLQAELSAYRDALAALVAQKTLEAEAIPSAEKAKLELKVSELELMSFQTEQRFKSAEEQVAFLTKQVKEFIVDKINLTGQLKSALAVEKKLEATIDKRDKALIEKDKDHAIKTQALQKTIIEKERTISQKDTLIEKISDEHKEALDKAIERADATATARDGYKASLEDLKTRHEELDVKYKAQLDTNLSQTRKLIEAQEELLNSAKNVERLETLLKKAKRLSKIVVQMNPDEE